MSFILAEQNNLHILKMYFYESFLILYFPASSLSCYYYCNYC